VENFRLALGLVSSCRQPESEGPGLDTGTLGWQSDETWCRAETEHRQLSGPPAAWRRPLFFERCGAVSAYGSSTCMARATAVRATAARAAAGSRVCASVAKRMRVTRRPSMADWTIETEAVSTGRG